MSASRAPLRPKKKSVLRPVKGVRLAVARTGLRYKGRDDLMLAAFEGGASVAGVFTQLASAAAPVSWCRKALKGGAARGLLVNAGNANAGTGGPGTALAARSAEAVAARLGCRKSEVFLASTGIIGEPWPPDALARFVPALAEKLAPAEKAWRKSAAAILTTDTFPKTASRTARIGGKKVVISGFAKGSGMIAPDMATLLAFVFTDADIPAPVLQKLLKTGAEKSFNAITVDGDTSTNDTLLAFASGKAKHVAVKSAKDRALKDFVRAFEAVLVDLAQQIIRDGEGAGKFITIDVTGAASGAAAKRMALTIANSPLVKTAMAASDANWGRVLAAATRAGEKVNIRRARIAMGGVTIYARGGVARGYDEAPVARHLKGREIHILFDAGAGKGKARVWTCDLTHGYIDINAGYRS